MGTFLGYYTTSIPFEALVGIQVMTLYLLLVEQINFLANHCKVFGFVAVNVEMTFIEIQNAPPWIERRKKLDSDAGHAYNIRRGLSKSIKQPAVLHVVIPAGFIIKTFLACFKYFD